MVMDLRIQSGRIDYIFEADGSDSLFGREMFRLTTHADGQSVLHSHCEIEAGPVADRSVVREVVYAMDKDWRPLDCFVRLHRSGAYFGSGWMRFAPDHVEGLLHNVEIGRIEQSFRPASAPRSVGAHPLVCDALHCTVFDFASAQKRQRSENIWMTSKELDGCSGPLLTQAAFEIEHLGDETLDLPAGSFETRHMCFHFDGHEYPAEEVWLMKDSFVPAKVWCGGYMQSRYVLAEYEDYYSKA
jgi:hypothetical protein